MCDSVHCHGLELNLQYTQGMPVEHYVRGIYVILSKQEKAVGTLSDRRVRVVYAVPWYHVDGAGRLNV